MFKVKIYVTYKPSILDPQGEAVKNAIHKLGHENVASVIQGKYFELLLEGREQDVSEQVEAVCDQLLANVNTETYRYELEPVTEG